MEDIRALRERQGLRLTKLQLEESNDSFTTSSYFSYSERICSCVESFCSESKARDGICTGSNGPRQMLYCQYDLASCFASGIFWGSRKQCKTASQGSPHTPCWNFCFRTVLLLHYKSSNLARPAYMSLMTKLKTTTQHPCKRNLMR